MIVGSVFERTPTSNPSSPSTTASTPSGFPQASHRSKKSAFARAREAKIAPKDQHVPLVAPSRDDWRAQMSRENEERVAAMTDEEREQERSDIIKQFGPGIGDLLKKVRSERRQDRIDERTDANSLEEVPFDSSPRTPRRPASTNTRPASRQLRFAEVSPDDVHVYESAPPSPRKKALALPPPTGEPSPDVVSLGHFGKHVVSSEPAEGTPEDIRRRFFPSAPANNPDLAWMMDDIAPPAAPGAPTLRFDLTGTPLAASLHASLPTHLGLHHHAPDADGVQRAGYTLDDVFVTSRSGVKAQRAAGMRMLAGIARWVAAVHRGDAEAVDGVRTAAEISGLKERVLAAGVEALSERGSLGAHAIEVVWECLVGWAEVDETLDPDLDPDLDNVELGSPDSTIPLAHLLSQLVVALSLQSESTSDLSSAASSTRILAILRRLARQTNEIATEIIATPSLIPSLFRTFLLANSPSAPADAALALDLLTTLASSTRANAQALTAPADALLRFVAVLPPPEPALLAKTLAFYAALAAYGLYAHIAGTAQEPLAGLVLYVQAPRADCHVRTAWARAIAAWTTCAVDPHRTTPGHDILWSQIVAWRWGQDVLALREVLGLEEWEAWAAIWHAEAVWLEGARVNGVRGGEAEREECVAAVKAGFDSDAGKEHAVVSGAVAALSSGLDRFGRGGALKLRTVGGYAETLTAAIRLWLACMPPPATDALLPAPPFTLPFSQLTELCAKLVTHSLWSRLQKCGPGYVLFRPFAGLISAYLRLSQRLPNVSQDVWMAQALAILSRLLPGDEEFALAVTQQILALITPQWALSHGLSISQTVWDKGGLAVIKPFLVRAIQPKVDVHIGQAWMSPTSIQAATTLRLPVPSLAFSQREFGLPVARDWTFSPLDHLLRSGTSAVFEDLPPGWDASEIDITRAALLLTEISRQLSSRFSFAEFVLTREEAVFGCIKVFMLEHGQAQSDSAEEVFRDRMVGQLMDGLLAPYTVGAAPDGSPSPSQLDLEGVAAGFLGSSTPFYQYYTDFVALYDAISFSHPTFARLLLPPTSMRYAPDYRRHLWNDFGHVLKTISTEPKDVVAADLGEFLWPVESDAQMVGAYLRALVKVPLQGFLRFLATHHVACNIWPDLRQVAEKPGAEEDRAERLLRVVIDQGALEVVADVMHYRQTSGAGPVSLPPSCFDLDADAKRARLEYIDRVGGPALSSRLKGLLQ